MTDNEIIKALECCGEFHNKRDCSKCPYCNIKIACSIKLKNDARDLINRQKAEIERFELLLLGVMHFVDKWLDGAELKQDEVNRARAMREKTLQIVEKLEEENDFLKSIDIDKIKAEAVKEFAEAYKDQIEDCTGMFTDEGFYVPIDAVLNAVDFIRERLVGDTDV